MNIPSNLHPKFVAAMESLKRIPQDQRRNNPAASALFEQAVTYAPDHLQEIFHAKAREMGLLPEATHYTEGGEPLYSTAQLAQHLGIPLEEANQSAQDLMEKHPDLAIQNDSTTIHRRQ